MPWSTLSTLCTPTWLCGAAQRISPDGAILPDTVMQGGNRALIRGELLDTKVALFMSADVLQISTWYQQGQQTTLPWMDTYLMFYKLELHSPHCALLGSELFRSISCVKVTRVWHIVPTACQAYEYVTCHKLGLAHLHLHTFGG